MLRTSNEREIPHHIHYSWRFASKLVQIW